MTSHLDSLFFHFSGNLYYALTHSPEPMDDQYTRALSWEAATERLEAAGSIPVKEAELMNEALSSEQAGVEVRFARSLRSWRWTLNKNRLLTFFDGLV
jgi:hypothetical protein